MRFRALLMAAVVAAPVAAQAQIVIRPEREPARVAADEAWYRAGDPVTWRGELFYPAGAQVFFNATLMVLAGEYRGVPLYVDPTIETGSIVYVPIGSRLMQAYERLRAGDPAGTSGSRPPPFPPEIASAAGQASEAARGRGMWLQWNGQAWRASGAAVRVGPQFVAIGTLNGRTVYRGPDGEGTIWVETAQGLASPWKIQSR